MARLTIVSEPMLAMETFLPPARWLSALAPGEPSSLFPQPASIRPAAAASMAPRWMPQFGCVFLFMVSVVSFRIKSSTFVSKHCLHQTSDVVVEEFVGLFVGSANFCLGALNFGGILHAPVQADGFGRRAWKYLLRLFG